MKIFRTTLLVLALTIVPVGATASASSSGTPAEQEESGSRTLDRGMANILPESSAMVPAELNDQPPGASALDLSLFGIISLGIIGLFWIRRHTAEF